MTTGTGTLPYLTVREQEDFFTLLGTEIFPRLYYKFRQQEHLLAM
jgi:hypothetical protein